MANKEQFMASIAEAAAAPAPGTEPPEPAGAAPVPETPPGGSPEPVSEAPDTKASPDIPEPVAEAPPAPKGMKQFLADAGLDIADIYEFKIPGTEITLEEARAAAPDIADVARMKLSLQEDRDKVVKQQTASNGQLAWAVQQLAQEFGQERVEALFKQAPEGHQQALAAENQELLRWHPELADEMAYAAAHKRMVARAEQYGISSHHVSAAGHQMKRMLLRLDQLESYVDGTRAQQKPPKETRAAPKEGNKPRKPNRMRQSTTDRRKSDFATALRDAAN